MLLLECQKLTKDASSLLLGASYFGLKVWLDVYCKDCVHVKNCKDKEKPQHQLCVRFIDYSETKGFRIAEKLMQSNKPVWLG
jgi:hypothetical protein